MMADNIGPDGLTDAQRAARFAAIRASNNANVTPLDGRQTQQTAALLKKMRRHQENKAASLQGYENQSWGEKGERQTARILQKELGHLQVTSIPTIRHFKPVERSGYYTFAGAHKAKGDIMSIHPGTGRFGIPCLTEVKFHEGNTLPWGALSRKAKRGIPQPHQSENLNAWEADGGLSLLSWVWQPAPRKYEVCIMEWATVIQPEDEGGAGFRFRHSISKDWAMENRINKGNK